MTLVNMCGGCPHNPIKQTTVVGGAEVVPEWMQHVKNTFWNRPEDTLTDGKPVHLKEYMETLARYQNKDMLYLIGELPAEYRPVFEKMFDTLIKRMVENQITSIPLS